MQFVLEHSLTSEGSRLIVSTTLRPTSNPSPQSLPRSLIRRFSALSLLPCSLQLMGILSTANFLDGDSGRGGQVS